MTSPATSPASPEPSAAGARSAPSGRESRSYGADPAQVYDVIGPPAGVAPLGATVLVVHGGFWRARYDRVHALPEAEALARAGYHVALGEYRRVGMSGGGVPGTLADVRDLVSAVRADPALPHRVVLVGHSAGGHLVVWAANQPWASGLAGVVSLSGVVDLAAADRLHLGADATHDFVGSGPGSAAWTSADPMASLPPRVPVRLLGAGDDVDVPPEVADDYVARACAAGGDVTAEVVPGAGHFALIDPDDPAFARVLAAVRSLAP